jgi:hypothetical protein
MSVIGSTEDGQIGVTEKEIRSFQPFFVDHDPPKILTEGDEISLPVVLRNYLDRPQTVTLDMKPESWFSMLGPASKRSEVPAGDAKRETFDLRAIESVKDGKQRVTGIGGDANDAIEKPVTVHPDGEETVSTASQVFTTSAALDVNVPSEALTSSRRAELKIYPNLLAHVTEGIEGILQRPHGCGEQTISSTYPNLIALRYLKGAGKDTPVAVKAQKYLQEGYERLLNYRSADGGFSYWGGSSESDLALTAYALRFLSDARGFITVDNEVIRATREWLITRQLPDGSWPARYHWENKEDRRRSSLLTAYIARALAMTAKTEASADTGGRGPDVDSKTAPDGTVRSDSGEAAGRQAPRVTAIRRALDLLAIRTEEIDEPYLIAAYALAEFSSGENARGAAAVAKLRKLALAKDGTSYWSLETNTPFYGWGMAGRIETSALAVQAIVRDAELQQDDALAKADEELINRGLLFLLRQKDRYGVWYSTQATVNVFDAFTAVVSRVTNRGAQSSDQSSLSAEVLVNGKSVATVPMPASEGLANPILVDVTRFLATGTNHFEIHRGGNPTQASAQMVATYYMPWSKSTALANTNTRPGGASALRLAVAFNKTSATVTDEITCHVEAERIGFRGNGMMLAEIGLPPGADVDRASLDKTIKASGWDISQYDVLPDRLVVYLWPRAGGTKFDFSFRPRFGLKAQSAPSVLYDYYNPEARVTVVPTSFEVN